MASFIVKPKRDRDFYVNWSTVVDDVTACGTRAELAEYLRGYWRPNSADPARFERADRTGSSACGEAEGWYGWDYDEFCLGQYEESRAVQRADLEAYATALCTDGMEAAVKHTYLLTEDDDEEDS